MPQPAIWGVGGVAHEIIQYLAQPAVRAVKVMGWMAGWIQQIDVTNVCYFMKP